MKFPMISLKQLNEIANDIALKDMKMVMINPG